jgi:phosphoglycerol transferase MdoB-like AlkP superfamily enzyme
MPNENWKEKRMKGWNRFLAQWQKDFSLWLFFIVYFLLFRLAFIFLFRYQINDASTSMDILAAILNGMRYDSVIATYYILIPFVFSIACLFANWEATGNRIRNVFGAVFIFLSTFLCFVTLGYFKEFDDQFNHFLFGLIYDDFRATILTIWKEYNIIPNFIGISLVTLLCLGIMRHLTKKPFLSCESIAKYMPTLPYRIFSLLIILSFFAVGIRGSFGSRPVQLKDAAVTGDEFLNKTVLNPYTVLIHAIEQQLKILRSQGLKVFLPNEDVTKAAQYVSSINETYDNLDRYMIRYAKGPKHKPPRHIFLIVGEGYSAWPLWKKYESLGLAESVKKLAKNGLYVESFLPSARGTMSSLAVLVTGLPNAGVMTNYQKTSMTAYPSSIAAIFKQLGYKTRLFYGGLLSWQRIGDFCRAQGFADVYGGAHMGNWASSNEWGVDDENLFEFILNTVEDEQPSFNLVLTTSFHPPFDIDVRSKGFQLNEIPDGLKPFCISNVNFNVLGHFWYADRCIGDFAKKTEAKLKFPLVVVTADHAGRRRISKRPGLFEKFAVPLVFYGKDVLDGISLPQGVAGSHLDIGPTLIELTAPEGFRYHALGKDLLDPEQRFVGIARNLVIGPDFILDLHKAPKLYPLPDRELPHTPPNLAELKRLHDTIHGIAWWRITSGPEL